MMTLPRRRFLHLAGGAVALPALSRIARAESYPSRPVRWIVAFAAGGPNDTTARLIAQYLSDHFGQQVFVENHTGAGGNVGMQAALSAPPDGYTIAFVGPNNAISATLYQKLPFDFIRDSVPVAGTMQLTNVLVANLALPVSNLTEFIAYAKANPGKINYASPGVGTLPHVAGELFRALTGVDIVHVPYRAAYLPDLLAGEVQAAFSPISTSLDFIAQGKLRPLGVTSETRADVLRDVPALAEAVPGYAAYIWDALAAPKDTPRDVVATLNREINAVLADPTVRGRLIALGADPLVMPAADAAKFVADETAKWGKVIRNAGIKAE
jgi:tripartite-type tricarboxylate transporter receptor subunit TctC